MVLLLTVIISLPANSAPLTHQALKTTSSCLIARDLTLARPDANLGPTKVKVGIYLIDLLGIDVLEEM